MEESNIEKKPTKGSHVLVLTSTLQGHLNPMLQFSKRLAFKGLKLTFITTSSTPSQYPLSPPSNIEFIKIYDGFTQNDAVGDIGDHLKRLSKCTSQSLVELIEHFNQNMESLNPTPKMVIYDSLMPWVLDVVKKRGLLGAPFFTQSCVVNSIYYHVYKGDLKTPIDGSSLVSLPCINEYFRMDDFPSFVSFPNYYPSLVRLVLDQFSNFKEAYCLFVNSIDNLEMEVFNWMSTKMPVKTIGPAIPSMYIDKRFPNDKDYGLSLFKPETSICIPWLDSKEHGSVIYASMGSLASLGEAQMEEMAIGFEKSNNYFLWVVRASEENKLPSGFKHRTSEKGLIVNWCPQLDVLAHPALGCFVTHCGWNSTLEAVTLGVLMVGFPVWTDQPCNAKCIAGLWKVGVRVKVNEEGIVMREEIEGCIRQVMEGEKAKEIQRNAKKWKEVAVKAMEEGGSSDRNIEEFVAKLLAS